MISKKALLLSKAHGSYKGYGHYPELSMIKSTYGGHNKVASVVFSYYPEVVYTLDSTINDLHFNRIVNQSGPRLNGSSQLSHQARQLADVTYLSDPWGGYLRSTVSSTSRSLQSIFYVKNPERNAAFPGIRTPVVDGLCRYTFHNNAIIKSVFAYNGAIPTQLNDASCPKLTYTSGGSVDDKAFHAQVRKAQNNTFGKVIFTGTSYTPYLGINSRYYYVNGADKNTRFAEQVDQKRSNGDVITRSRTETFDHRGRLIENISNQYEPYTDSGDMQLHDKVVTDYAYSSGAQSILTYGSPGLVDSSGTSRLPLKVVSQIVHYEPDHASQKKVVINGGREYQYAHYNHGQSAKVTWVKNLKTNSTTSTIYKKSTSASGVPLRLPQTIAHATADVGTFITQNDWHQYRAYAPEVSIGLLVVKQPGIQLSSGSYWRIQKTASFFHPESLSALSAMGIDISRAD